MIPVQVGTRITDMVDSARAASLARGSNVKAVRDRRTRSIVRLIITPLELGNGRADEPSGVADSRKTTFRERLFTDHEPDEHMLLSDGTRTLRKSTVPLAGTGFVFSFKHSSTYAPPRTSGRREGKSAPTTTPTPSRPGGKRG